MWLSLPYRIITKLLYWVLFTTLYLTVCHLKCFHRISFTNLLNITRCINIRNDRTKRSFCHWWILLVPWARLDEIGMSGEIADGRRAAQVTENLQIKSFAMQPTGFSLHIPERGGHILSATGWRCIFSPQLHMHLRNSIGDTQKRPKIQQSAQSVPPTRCFWHAVLFNNKGPGFNLIKKTSPLGTG